jgi:probable F420-dependent oxidoreductase
LGTEVLILPQRQPVLVAKQVSTLDTLSGGRVRLGVGVGWQESEYDALEESFNNRGKRMNEAIDVLRAYWRDAQVDHQGTHYTSTAMAMEPKPPQGANLPIWIGGAAPASLARVGTHGDGWLAYAFRDRDKVLKCRETIEEAAIGAGRDPAAIGYQTMFDLPPTDADGKGFYADLDQVGARALAIREQGFEWSAVNVTAVFQAGARSVDALLEALGNIHERVQSEVG